MSKKIYLFSISSHPDTISINSLDIKFLSVKIDFSKYDYLIITSKQASKALKQYNRMDYIQKPALCVSKQSALSYEKLGGEILDIGEGYGDNLVNKIKTYPKHRKWLYLRAELVASDFVSICQKDGYSIDEAVVYKSECSKEIINSKVQTNSVLIFTSPSSVKCFLKNHIISSDLKVIVIGNTTAKALPPHISYIVSDETNIKRCIEIAKKC